jgi:enterobacterial common antigen flippase
MEDAKVNKADAPYKQILKPTFIMGGASIINSLLAVARIKFIALTLGPAGVGLIGIYQTVSSLVSTLCGMGIGESGVRQIAEASGTDDQEKIARTVFIIRRVALLSGTAGACILYLLRNDCSRLTFGNYAHAGDIAILSVTIFFSAIYSAQLALIQGLRRIADLAKVNILGAFFGTLLSIPIIYFFGEKGVAYYFLIVSATGVLTSWWYSRKIKAAVVKLCLRDSLTMAKPLLKLGLALMLGFFMSLCTAYTLRVLVVRYNGLDAAGIYHAATTLSTVYVGIILNAMMTDFYPRLSASAQDHDACRYLINKQIEVGLLLAFPGILAVMTFAPFVIAMFYSPKFMQAVDILRWQILGVLLQVVNWPMGIMLRAKGNGMLFFLTELFVTVSQLVLCWVGMKLFGLAGIGMGFFGMNLFYGILIFNIVRKCYSFSFSVQNIKMLAMFALATGIVFLTPYFIAGLTGTIINVCTTAAVAIGSVVILCNRSDMDMMPRFLLKFKKRLGFELK